MQETTSPTEEELPAGPRLRRPKQAAAATQRPRRERATARLSHRLEYGAFLLVEKLAHGLGVERASGLFGFLWRKLGPLSERHRRAMAHLALAFPEKGPAEHRRIADAMWDNLGRSFAESFFLESLISDPRVTVDPEIARHFGDRGLVLATLHAGNWEVAAAGATRHGYKVAGVYRPLSNPFVEQRVVRMRAPLYRGGLFQKGGDIVRPLLAWAKSGQPVGIVSDQRDPRGIPVPFFGRPAPSTPFPAYVARAAGVPLLAARVVRLPGVRFRIDLQPVEVPHTGDRMADIGAATEALHALFERWIREDPAQWMWTHRRWA